MPGLVAAVGRALVHVVPVVAVLAVAGGSAIGADSRALSPVAAFGFDEAAGSTLTDVSGNGHNGEISGALWTAAGRYGGALSFDGENDLVTIADTDRLDLRDAMTLEAWVQPRSLGTSWRTAVVKEQSTTLAYALYAHTNYSGPSGHVFTSGADRRARAASTLALDEWSHVAATYDGTTIRVYLNAEEVAQDRVSGPIAASSGPLRIGGTQLWSEWFHGLIDEVRVYDRALTAAEIAGDMDVRVGAAPDRTPPAAPSQVVRIASSATSASLSWTASSDDVGVTQYGLYRDGARVGATTSTAADFTELRCGTTYGLGVDAADAAGNRSSATTVTVTTAACPSPPPPPASRPGLVAAYGFDEASGAGVVDASGRGHAGTLVGAVRSSSGRYGGAVSFDGLDDFVTIADSAGLDLASGMTLEAWVRPTTLGNRWRTVLIKERENALAYGLYAHTGGRGPSGHAFVGGRDRRARASILVPTVTWTHLAATYDGATIRVYRNGSVVATERASGAVSTSSAPLRIGGNSVWNEWFDGLIDEVRVYERSLSASEIAADMQTPIATHAPTADTTAPTAPGDVAGSGATQTAITLSWSAAADDVGVTEYGAYRNGAPVGTTAGTTATFTGLECGTTYTLGVDAADAAGNRSGRVTISAATSACPPSGGGDTSAPSTPGGLGVSSSGETSLAIGWSAATDNVGVTGYGIYRNSVLVGTTTSRTYSFSGLACGTSYTLGVDAYDAAGNRSGRASVSGSTTACPAPPPGSGTANLYVAAGASTTSSCTVSAPCGSFDRAYRLAQPGWAVEVAGGSYGSMTIGKDASKTSSTDVLFRPAAGATVTLASLDISGSHVEVRDMRVTAGAEVDSSPIDTRDVTLRNVSARSMFLRADNVTVIGGSFGGFNGCDPGMPEDAVKMWNDSSRGADGIVLDGITIHDVRRIGCSIHTDCIQIYSGTNHTIKNSLFYNCPTTGIIARPSGSSQALANITIENNFFGSVLDGTEAINIGTAPDRCENIVIRYNTVANEAASFDCVTATGAPGSLVEGNILNVGCQDDAVFRYNVFRPGSAVCGTGAVQCAPAYVNSTGFDFRLAPGDTCARGRGNPGSHPAADADGQARPQGTIDAGADEIG